MNPAAILALIGDLYAQIAELNAEVEALRARLAAKSEGDGTDPPDAR